LSGPQDRPIVSPIGPRAIGRARKGAGPKLEGETGVVSQIVEQFKERLINGQLKAGDQVPPEPELCRQFGVSRTAVREAMRTLAAVGIVEIRRGHGTFVASSTLEAPMELLSVALMLSPTSRMHLFQVRVAIEEACARLVVENATDADIEPISRQIAAFEKAIKGKKSAATLRKLDQEFHMLLLDATHNPMFSRIGKAIMATFASTMERALASIDVYAISLKDHKEIRDAIVERSAERCLEVVRRSLGTWQAYLRPDNEPI
jgi:GntR family transcriptional regulator, transcriptional repressor for pyruvate dehydrogenase complex